jgi:hypothetical protein
MSALFSIAHDRWDFREPLNLAFAKRVFGGGTKCPRVEILSEQKNGRQRIKLAGLAQMLFLCGDFFESHRFVFPREAHELSSLHRIFKIPPATMKIVRCAGLKDLLARLMPLSVFFSTRGTRGGS